ncbi:MAG: pyruvate:ferredoxin (flavodoxin) oxidoreductase [Gemmatimonadales bacterium]
MSTHLMLDGNEAAARVAYAASEVIAIYPITPASPMGEYSDQWAADDQPNAWGATPVVVEMQSEGGAAGAVHGALQVGALTTSFTASQGLLLMLPNMYKIAGELTPMVLHVAARALATQGLSIFGDHSDVMAARSTGFAMLASGSPQEAMDLALVAHAATLTSRVPFLHFFDGFRTSHEIARVVPLTPEDVQALLPETARQAHRARALSPEHPVIRGTAQNPDVFFQAREASNPYYLACPALVQEAMDTVGARTGRHYNLVDYIGAPDAERVIVLMGSGAEVAHETVEALTAMGEKVGILKIRLFRPFPVAQFLAALPASVRSIAVLDRTKEPGAAGEPLYQDVITALMEGRDQLTAFPRVVGGRYGLASKEFTPAMVRAVFDELAAKSPRNHFTIGIQDDVTHTSLAWDPEFSSESPETVRAVFYGLGSDGTVGGNKEAIKIIGQEAGLHAQGYFVYDSKKSGSVTVSHLRFGKLPIRSSYLIHQASFVACHQFHLLDRMDVLEHAAPGAIVLLNSPWGPDSVWAQLPEGTRAQLVEKRLRLYVVDAQKVTRQVGLGGRINTVMQTCFFALTKLLPLEEATAAIKRRIAKTYGKRGEVIVEKNYAAVDAALAELHEVPLGPLGSGTRTRRLVVLPEAPAFVQEVTAPLLAGKGDALPVSAIPVDGTWPAATAQWEKRSLAAEIPEWDPDICIQCGKCVLVCPHAVIRGAVYEPERLEGAPDGFKSATARWRAFGEMRYTLQVSPEDCTGCKLCVEACPVKNKREVRKKAINMAPVAPIREREQASWNFFRAIPEIGRERLSLDHVKDVQLLQPLFEFSGACAGCGETPYLKLLSQLFGDRAVIANATGCSSIYGGNLPTTPWATNRDGRGPAWANSLFEDNAEFGMGMRVALDQQRLRAVQLLAQLAPAIGEELVTAILSADQHSDEGIAAQRARVVELRRRLAAASLPGATDLATLADTLVRRSVWIVGGDGWAYDIGFGGLDHVLASGRDVNLLVLDTEVYSNTGGQMSKSTPRAAVAKFAAGGKRMPKKDLGLFAMSYGHVYVGQVAMGEDDAHTVKVFREAEAFDGPSIIIAYSHCIAHGYDLVHGLDQQKLAVKSGHWPLFRFNPALAGTGKNPFQLDCKPPSVSLKAYAYNETRYTMLAHGHPETAAALLVQAEQDLAERWQRYAALAASPTPPAAPAPEGSHA